MMVKIFAIAIVLFTFSGCTFKSNGFNPQYIEGAKKFNNTKVNVKVATSKHDDANTITKYPTPYESSDEVASALRGLVKSAAGKALFTPNPGSGSKIVFDTGAVAKGIAKEIFESQTSPSNAREIFVRPYVIDLDYHYETLNNGFMAVSPSIDKINLTFTATENNKTIMEKTYGLQSPVDGKIYFSDTGEKFNEVFHKALLQLMENASNDLASLVGSNQAN